MSEAPALIRASYAKTVIGGIKRRSAAEQSLLWDRVGNELRQEVRGYGMLDWMPAQRFVALVTAVGDALPAERAKEFWKANLLLSLERRLLAPLRLGAIAIYGNSPRSLLKMTPQAWELVSKNGGTCMTTDREPAAIVLRFSSLPVEMRVPSLLQLWKGGSESCIARMGFTGGASSDGTRLSQGIAEILVEWTARP